MPNDFETCDTGTRNLVVQQGEKIERYERALEWIIERASQNGEDVSYLIAKQALHTEGND